MKSLDVVHVEMRNAPKSGRKPEYIDAWDWLYDQSIEWTDKHASELAAEASLDIEGRRDAEDDRHFRERWESAP